MIFIDKITFREQQKQAIIQHKSATQSATSTLLAALYQTPQWQNANSIATTVSSPIEVDTTDLIQTALTQGKQIYLPKTMSHRQMAFLPYPGTNHLIKNSYGLLEPPYESAKVNQTIDLLIVPGIAYDLTNHYRVGFGGGYYDRFMANFKGQTLSLVPPVMAFTTGTWPTEDYDQAIQTLITVDQIYYL